MIPNFSPTSRKKDNQMPSFSEIVAFIIVLALAAAFVGMIALYFWSCIDRQEAVTNINEDARKRKLDELSDDELYKEIQARGHAGFRTNKEG
jgi:hypothetical protein